MCIENVLAVTGATLLNSPSISRFTDISIKASTVKRGSLFIAFSNEEIQVAIDKGAYGIITDIDLAPTDKEIAWIKARSLKKTLIKLLRLWLALNPKKIYLLKPSVYNYSKTISTDRRAIFLSDDTILAAQTLVNSSEDQVIFSKNKEFLDRVGAKTIFLNRDKIDQILIKNGIFLTSAIVENRYYDNLPLCSYLYLDFIESIEILKSLNLEYSLSKLTYTDTFNPQFVDYNLNPIAFGKSERVIVFIDESAPEKIYLELEKVNWINVRLYTPTQIKFSYGISLPKIEYKNDEELLSFISKDRNKIGYFILINQKKDFFMEKLLKKICNDKLQIDKGLF